MRCRNILCWGHDPTEEDNCSFIGVKGCQHRKRYNQMAKAPDSITKGGRYKTDKIGVWYRIHDEYYRRGKK